MRAWQQLSAALALVIIAAACTGGGSPEPSASPTPSFARGGTLRAVFVNPQWYYPGTFDPQRAYKYDSWEVLRCCLLRTLLSYNGRSTDEGGAEIRPDLAIAMPEVSADGLTWTFRLRSGLHYGPPFEDTEIVAGDVVRALEREASPDVKAGYANYYDIIQGFAGYSSGDVGSISGLETPDDHTLVVRLTEPAGDLGYRLALPAAAPIPPGAADGHPDYGRFLVASGPYMFEGSQNLDFSAPPADQSPVSGFVPIQFTPSSSTQTPGSITLVRNPSWDGSTDPLRAAYVDRIKISLGGFDIEQWTDFSHPPHYTANLEMLFDQVVRGQLDVVLDASPTVDQLRKFRSDPHLAGLLYEDQISYVETIFMNLAVPPLDDTHVRKAINLVLDREDLQRRWLAAVSGQAISEATGGGVIATHIAPDALEGGLLLGYRPSWMDSSTGGDLAAAQAEMRQSAYDHDGDGLCDAPPCKHVELALTSAWPRPFDTLVQQDLAKIGVRVRVKRYGAPSPFYDPDGPMSPAARSAMTANGWLNDYPNGAAYFPYLFSGLTTDPGFFNFSLLGVTPGELRGWGYSVLHVTSVDDRIHQCVVATGQMQEACWARLDQYLMEEVVPWAPFLFQTAVRLVSARVAHYSMDQFTGLPALDQIALTPAAIEGSE